MAVDGLMSIEFSATVVGNGTLDVLSTDLA